MTHDTFSIRLIVVKRFEDIGSLKSMVKFPLDGSQYRGIFSSTDNFDEFITTNMLQTHLLSH